MVFYFVFKFQVPFFLVRFFMCFTQNLSTFFLSQILTTFRVLRVEPRSFVDSSWPFALSIGELCHGPVLSLGTHEPGDAGGLLILEMGVESHATI